MADIPKSNKLPTNAPMIAPAVAPNKKINELPTKKAKTVVKTASLLLLAKRRKLGVAVPPLIKEPITNPTKAVKVKAFSLEANI